MKDPLSSFTIIVAPDPTASVPQHPSISTNQLDPADIALLSTPTLSFPLLDGPNDYFAALYCPSRKRVSEKYKHVLSSAVQAIIEHCIDYCGSDSVFYEATHRDSVSLRASHPCASQLHTTVQWLELYDPQTESWLLPSREFVQAQHEWPPQNELHNWRPERFYSGTPRIILEVLSSEELRMEALISPECYPEALEHFLKATRSNEPSFLYQLWIESFYDFLDKNALLDTNNSDISIQRSYNTVIQSHSSTDLTNLECSALLIPNEEVSFLNNNLSFHCNISISLQSTPYPKPVFDWRVQR